VKAKNLTPSRAVPLDCLDQNQDALDRGLYRTRSKEAKSAGVTGAGSSRAEASLTRSLSIARIEEEEEEDVERKGGNELGASEIMEAVADAHRDAIRENGLHQLLKYNEG
jgi:hypothetical protein